MKKSILVVLIMSIIITLSACGTGNITSQEGVQGTGIAYEVKDETYTKDQISIKYPQLNNITDSDKQKKINELIKNEALKGINYFSGADNIKVMQINYIIMLQDANVLSIKYTGIGFGKNDKEPIQMLYSTNIDLNKESKISLKDFIDINGEFVNIFKNGQYKSLNPNANPMWKYTVKEILDKYSEKEMINKLKNSDNLDDVKSKNPDHVFYYLTNKSMTISISVDHSVGDFAEYIVRFDSISDKMRTNNTMWKYLSNLTKD